MITQIFSNASTEKVQKNSPHNTKIRIPCSKYPDPVNGKLEMRLELTTPSLRVKCSTD